ncbi:GspH/FimT family pseudopilin [Sansalvadorimonas verongulae]|uniref:GspH/FimT family pseudopilin n=1 Tax=Sansalvadorimonas verongulae TaxID=2172824 RepID=UPI0012BCC921|nr:GspH/FimT family pseudopilin [Sansalvadorimonas verongulae]MTI14988.1 prepilin-type N-terminal cleavage/methylation domain-containing protein [Sansalvadorimonas verongulae]
MKSGFRGWRASVGFTLVELMVVMAVLAILAGVVTPSFTDMVVRNGVSTHTNKMISLLRYARSEAISRQNSVVLCNGNTDGSACGNSTDIVLVVDEADGTVLLVSPPIPRQVVTQPANLNIRFEPNGSTSNSGEINFQNKGGDSIATLSVTRAGLVMNMGEGS